MSATKVAAVYILCCWPLILQHCAAFGLESLRGKCVVSFLVENL